MNESGGHDAMDCAEYGQGERPLIPVKSYQGGPGHCRQLQGLVVALQQRMWQTECKASHGYVDPTAVQSMTDQQKIWLSRVTRQLPFQPPVPEGPATLSGM